MPRAPTSETLEQRLLRYSSQPNDKCWEWIGGVYKNGGHGRLRFKYREVLAHRAAYEAWRGPIPAGLCVCHSCDNPKCINPSHLWLGTNIANIADRDSKNRGKWNPHAGDNGRRAKRDNGGRFLRSASNPRVVT